MRVIVLAAVALFALAGSAQPAKAPGWETGAPLPVARSEVAATTVGGEVVVAGGFLNDGSSSPRVDAYSPATNRWRRLPDLPLGVNHAMAAAARGRVYALGGYSSDGRALRDAYVLAGRRWSPLKAMPESRAAAGAAVVGHRLYVVGGVTDEGGGRRLAGTTLVFDLATRRWSKIKGPTPREHLGVAATLGRVYAVGGRTAGLDTNVDLVEAYDPAVARWRRLTPVPDARGGTAAAAWRGTVVSAGGEEPGGTIASVYALNTSTGRWRRLPDLGTPRHGLGAVYAAGRVWVVAGGRTPGLSVSGVNESLALR